MDYTNAFMIDTTVCPKPNIWAVKSHLISADDKRLPANGEAVIPYKGYAYGAIWTYKNMKASDYNKIYKACFTNTISNKVCIIQLKH